MPKILRTLAAALVLIACGLVLAGAPAAAGRVALPRIAGESYAAYQARAAAACPSNRACAWSGYFDSADQGSLWYYTYAQLQAGVSWSGTGADLNTSSWYNRLTPVGTAGAPYMLMSNQDNCVTSSGTYVRLAAGQVANGRNPATNWDNAFRSVFTQPPSGC